MRDAGKLVEYELRQRRTRPESWGTRVGCVCQKCGVGLTLSPPVPRLRMSSLKARFRANPS